MGRPVFGLLYLGAFSRIYSIGDLRWLRVAGILGIAAFATAFYYELKRQDLPHSLVLMLSFLIGLMPPFQVYAAWATIAPASWAAFLACVSFMIGQRSPARFGWGDLVTAFIILTAALATYQPAAMIFWLFASIAWLTAPELPAPYDVIRAGSVMEAALIAEYALAKSLPLFLYSNETIARSALVADIPGIFARSALVSDIPGKMSWFLASLCSTL
jgi:hypothetical protein